MKPNKKIVDLIMEGFSIETLKGFSDSQIDKLHKKIVKEQTNVLKVPKGSPAEKDAQNKKMAYMTYEGELEEKKDKKKSNKKNPWAICTSSLSDEFGTSERSEWTKSQMKKYERCVMDVKKSIKEGRSPLEPIIESKIVSIVEKHLSPKMNKKDFLGILENTKTKPKPTTKPDTKPGKGSPWSPKPGQDPDKKAKKHVEEQGTKTKPKPTTKPDTKPGKGNPYSPKPGQDPRPKAVGNSKIPSWFTFNKLGIQLNK